MESEPRRKPVGCLVVGLAVALVASVLFNLVLVSGSALFKGSAASFETPRLKEKVLIRGSGKGKIARIDLEGMISSLGGGVEGMKRALSQAVNDKYVKAIVLYVNSPGGEVTASDTIYHAVKRANAKKPIVVYMDSVAASGGYYIACGASKIVANETTLTGSIGVIMQSLNYSDLFGKVGLETMTFRSGEFKDTLSGSRKMREDEKTYVQGLIDQMYQKFVGIVSEARGIPADQLKNGIADGRVVTGITALEHKLVDRNGYVEDAYAEAESLGGLSDATVVQYARPGGLLQFLDLLGEAESGGGRKVEIDVAERLLPRLEPGRAYFLPASFGH